MEISRMRILALYFMFAVAVVLGCIPRLDAAECQFPALFRCADSCLCLPVGPEKK
jgi:hypothetical protein